MFNYQPTGGSIVQLLLRIKANKFSYSKCDDGAAGGEKVFWFFWFFFFSFWACQMTMKIAKFVGCFFYDYLNYYQLLLVLLVLLVFLILLLLLSSFIIFYSCSSQSFCDISIAYLPIFGNCSWSPMVLSSHPTASSSRYYQVGKY